MSLQVGKLFSTEDGMTASEMLIGGMYRAFNERNVDVALAQMSESVSWPKASEGGRVVGKEEIRAYWRRQWQDFNPQVTPIEITDPGDGKIEVRVHQLVKSLGGETLSDTEVLHVYTVVGGLIERMDLGGSEAAGETASSAFAHR